MLTVKTLRGLRPRRSAYRVFDGSTPGFHVTVAAGGTITFYVRYKPPGSQRYTYTRIGQWPTWSLAEARQEARALRQRIDQGLPPRELSAPPERRGTVRELIAGYHAHLVAHGRSTADEVRHMLDTQALDALGPDRPAVAVTAADIAEDVLRPVIERGSPGQARKLRAALHAAFNWALRHDHDPWRDAAQGVKFGLSVNPVASIPTRPGGTRARTRVLSWDELVEAWHTDRLPLPWRLAVRLLLLTGGQRVRQLLWAPWEEIDLQRRVWTIPAERMKTARPHVLPLVETACSTLAQVRQWSGPRWLFPARFSVQATEPVSKEALTRAISRAGYDWTPHDLRRTCKTLMGEAGVSKFDRDRIQAHVISDVSGVHYDHYDYLAEKRAGLERWEKALLERV